VLLASPERLVFPDGITLLPWSTTCSATWTDIVKRPMPCSVLVAFSRQSGGSILSKGNLLPCLTPRRACLSRTGSPSKATHCLSPCQSESLALYPVKPEQGESLSLCPVKQKYRYSLSLCFTEQVCSGHTLINCFINWLVPHNP